MFSVSDAQAILDPALREQIEKHPRAQDLLRAFLYPYDAPDHDFLFGDGIVSPLPRDSIADRIAGRTPVLAIGSNRAPVQLARKFSPPHHHENVPVTMGWMAHHDVVYSAHITGYGALPATLAPSPGTRVRMAVTWLTHDQLSHMHVTEAVPAHYRYCQLAGHDVVLDCGVTVDHVGSYQSAMGWVFNGDDVFALSAIKASNRRFATASQWDMIQYMARRAGMVARPEFVLRLMDDPVFRQSLAGPR